MFISKAIEGAKTVINNLKGFSEGFIKSLDKIIEIGEMALGKLKIIIEKIAKIFGLISESMDLYELGKEIMFGKEDGINREDFKDFKEYSEELRKKEYDVRIPATKEEKQEAELVAATVLKKEIDNIANYEIPPILLSKFDSLKLEIQNLDLPKVGEILKKYGITEESCKEFKNKNLKLSDEIKFVDGLHALSREFGEGNTRTELSDEFRKED